MVGLTLGYTPPIAEVLPIQPLLTLRRFSLSFCSESFVRDYRIGLNFYQHLWRNEGADCNQGCCGPDVAKHFSVGFPNLLPVGDVLNVSAGANNVFHARAGPFQSGRD